MKDTRNWAEHDKQVRENPTDEQAYKMGGTHAAYNWVSHPPGNWPEHQQALYRQGYEDCKKETQA